MIPSVHLGALAAVVVLLVPMAMAGLHLSLNRILFFSCALFVSLAIAVHVSPFLPIPRFHVSPPPSTPSSSSCLSLAHRPLWLHRPNLTSWLWPPPPPSCPSLRPLSPSSASSLLASFRIVLAGDSQVRLFTLCLLALLADNSTFPLAQQQLSKRHSDYLANLNGITVHYVWAPFEANLTTALVMMKEERSHPDLLVMGSGLWHMLHSTDSVKYGEHLRVLTHLAESLSRGDPPSPRMFWLGMPTLINSMLNSEEKRQRMTPLTCEAYEMELARSGMLEEDGGPFVFLDFGRLSRSCGVQCTEDGMHYGSFVYDVAVQAMLNVLLAESELRYKV